MAVLCLALVASLDMLLHYCFIAGSRAALRLLLWHYYYYYNYGRATRFNKVPNKVRPLQWKDFSLCANCLTTPTVRPPYPPTYFDFARAAWLAALSVLERISLRPCKSMHPRTNATPRRSVCKDAWRSARGIACERTWRSKNTSENAWRFNP